MREGGVQAHDTGNQVQAAERMLVALFLQEGLEARGRVGALLHSHARQRRATRTLQTRLRSPRARAPSPLRLS